LTGYIFPERREGTPAERRNRIKLMLRWACQKAKVPYGRKVGGITFHSFRHTGASRMLEAGVDPRTVQEIGGWASLSQVMRYTHPTEATKRNAVEQI
jgi:integrase